MLQMLLIIIVLLFLPQVVSEQWDGVLGRCDITVSSEPVRPGDLSVQVVSGLGMSVTGSSTHPSIITTTVTAYNILYNHHQVREWSLVWCDVNCTDGRGCRDFQKMFNSYFDSLDYRTVFSHILNPS